ncbi:MAG: hypothetical protein Kow0031_35530 [Anaerolineae bacterium]
MQSEQAKPLFTGAAGIRLNQKGWRGTAVTLKAHRQLVFTSVTLLALFVGVLAAIQFSTPALAGNDGYYHIKLAQVMRENGLRPAFTWLPLTILNVQDYYDHHYLYHILLIPFTFGDLRQGAKVASVIFPALTFFMGWLLLRGQRVPLSALWAVGFVAVSEAFLYRMSMPRAQSLSLLMLLLALHLTFTGRHRWLLPVGFLYVWLYNAFPLLLVVVGTYVAATWLLERQFQPAPLLYAAGGVALGLVINPYFPQNLVFIYNHLAPKLVDATATKVGNEWYPYRTWTLVENSALALGLFAAGIFALGLNSRRMSVPTATVLVLALLFGAMLFKSRRFVEYWPAFALLFGALSAAPLLEQWGKAGKAYTLAIAAALLLLFVPATWLNIEGASENMRDSKPAETYADASGWLVANTPAGSRVFQTDWDDFTRLFFYNTHNTYTAGLDPTYLQLHDPELFDRWVDITKGRVETPSRDIGELFAANYVISDLNHKDFIKAAQADPALEEVYRDDYAVIFQLTSAN